ncbi:unnamed protein product, partial [Porites lobata]
NGKTCFVHHFVWECFNGIIPENKVIDHINNNKQDNRLCNLQLMTQQENCQKSAKNRDYTFGPKNCQNKNMYAVQQHLGINAGIIKMICEGINRCKSGNSKKDGQRYKFEYI